MTVVNEQDIKLQGIGGWLILVLIGLIVTPLRLSFLLIRTHLPILTGDRWSALTNPSSPSYHPLWAPVILFEIAMNVGFIVSSLALLFFMLNKSSVFPRLMIAYYLANVLLVIADHFGLAPI